MSTDVSEVRAALMMEAARTSGTSVDIQIITRQYIPEDSELHTLVIVIAISDPRILLDSSAQTNYMKIDSLLAYGAL
jgi:hypothetical protein